MSTSPSFVPVILSGGAGSRLWPLSRTLLPKQLLCLTSPEHSLLQTTLLRAMALPGAKPPCIVGNEMHRFMLQEQVQAVGHQCQAIILEPAPRNTAPAIALAALQLHKTAPDSIMLVLPADHVVDDQDLFAQTVAHGLVAAAQGQLVTFGIAATEPATGYGYIQRGAELGAAAPGVHRVARFVEKPDASTAQSFVDAGDYLWNSGMFVFRADTYLQALKTLQAPMYTAAVAAMQNADNDSLLEFIRPNASAFSTSPSDSIDYAIMQKTDNAAVVPAAFGWSDIGSWDSLWEISNKDEKGNAIRGDVYHHNTHNSYLRAENRLLAVIGLDDVVVVETKDAVLVMHREKAQQVKGAVEYFTSMGRKEYQENTRVYRPWGWYEGIDAGERFQVKRIMVKPGGILSLQMHYHRAEHWVVVRGTAKVRVGERDSLISENESIYIPIGTTHRLENPGKMPLHLIEVQSGAYVGEDDIVRYEDSYGRAGGGK